MFRFRPMLPALAVMLVMTMNMGSAGAQVITSPIPTFDSEPTRCTPRSTLRPECGHVPENLTPSQVISTETTELVVDFADDTSLEQVREVEGATGVHFSPNSILVSEDRIYRVTVPTAQVETITNLLYHQNRGISAVEENRTMTAYFTPNDPRFQEQWGFMRVGATSAWNTTCGSGVTVAVIDTGVACETYNQFPQLSDLAGTRCVPGYDFVDDDTHPNDEQGHGSHVAGTIAQTTNNAMGVAGIAYCASIMPVRVLDSRGSGSLADVAEGIIWASDHGAQVINLSLGGGGHSQVMANAVAHARSKGTVVVCAAGNNGRYVESPAVEPGAFAVSALDSTDHLASFSSRGPEVDIAAPGVNILQQTVCFPRSGRCTCPGNATQCEIFVAWSGTSMASPHTAAVAALVMSMGVTDPDAVENILKETAATPVAGNGTTITEFDKNLFGAGIVSAKNAIQSIQLKQIMYRGLALIAIILGLVFGIKNANGKTVAPQKWVPFALVTSIGLLWFVPFVLPYTFPGLSFLVKPMGDWTLSLGIHIHKWLPLGNAAIIMLLVGLFSGRKELKAPIGGLSAGMAAYLTASYFLGHVVSPLGSTVHTVWLMANIGICLWVARMNVDEVTIDSKV